MLPCQHSGKTEGMNGCVHMSRVLKHCSQQAKGIKPHLRAGTPHVHPPLAPCLAGAAGQESSTPSQPGSRRGSMMWV
jgi:hypothetical protein